MLLGVLFFADNASKWHQRVSCHLEMLFAERDPYDRDAEDESEQKMYGGNLPPSIYHPKNVESGGQTSRRRVYRDFLAERAKGQNSKSDDFQPERDTDDRDAHQQSSDKIHQGCEKTSQKEPYYVTESSHILAISSLQI